VLSRCTDPTRGALLQPVYKVVEDTLPVALAACLVSDFGGDHRHDADNLRLRGKPVRIEIVGRPRQIVVHAVETEAEEMLSLLCGAPPVPAGWFIGASDRGQPRDSYKVAILVNGTGLAQPCIEGLAMPAYVRTPCSKASKLRACV
jgi:hypothetical protein